MGLGRVFHLLGKLLILLGLFMLLPLFWSIYYGESDLWPFIISALITISAGFVLTKITPLPENLHVREAYALVVFGWLVAAAFGAMPYLFDGVFSSFADAFFEAMSGFTTTGASVLTDIEAQSHGILFWRALTHWLGGMGIVVLLVALMAEIGVTGFFLFQAESPGATKQKIRPRISDTAKILWQTYIVITLAEVVLLYLAGMNLFDALCHTFATVATGGFSTKNLSVGYYQSAAIDWIIIIFMFLAGANFSLYWQALHNKDLRCFWRNEEFRLYAVIVLGAVLLVTLIIIPFGYPNPFEAFRFAAFQVTSIITTTGFMTANFDLWPIPAQGILVILMLIGGCSGSTSGSIKVGRLLLLFKEVFIELKRLIHPRVVAHIKLEGKSLPENIGAKLGAFFFLYILIMGISSLLIVATGLDFVSSVTAVMATLGNVGPGLNVVGPAQNYAVLSAGAKYLLSFLMLFGRLEIFPVIILITRAFWRG